MSEGATERRSDGGRKRVRENERGESVCICVSVGGWVGGSLHWWVNEKKSPCPFVSVRVRPCPSVSVRVRACLCARLRARACTRACMRERARA